MPRVPPENVRPTGSSVPPENAEPDASDSPSGGGLPPGFEYLDTAGPISLAVGITELGLAGVGSYTLPDGTEDGQEKVILLTYDATMAQARGINCNFYRTRGANYSAINSNIQLVGSRAFVRLRWTEGVPTTGGPEDLWVIVASSPHSSLGTHARIEINHGQVPS